MKQIKLDCIKEFGCFNDNAIIVVHDNGSFTLGCKLYGCPKCCRICSGEKNNSLCGKKNRTITNDEVNAGLKMLARISEIIKENENAGKN